MQKNKKRKGFTLTELAIVIAVIAILIAVLVPTFTSLITSANESADEQAVKSMNTALATDEALNETPETIEDAMKVLTDAGYNVENYQALDSNNTIYYDSTYNRCLLWSAEDEAVIYPSDLAETYKGVSGRAASWYTLSDAYHTQTVGSDGKTSDGKTVADIVSDTTAGETVIVQLTTDLTGSNSITTSLNNGSYTFTLNGENVTRSAISGVYVTIDLNGHELDMTSSSTTCVIDGGTLYIKNGSIDTGSNITGSSSLYVATDSASITFENVDVTSAGTVLFPGGDAAQVNVINSTIYTTGSFCISTNATVGYTCTILVEGSTLQVEAGYTTICVNVSATLTINNSTIIAGNCEGKGTLSGIAAQAIICRAGTVNISDSTVTLYTNSETNEKNNSWSSGNSVPFTAVVIGNATSSYNSADAEVNMTNSTVNVLDYSTGDTLSGARAIYMYGSSDIENGAATLNFDANTSIGGYIVVGTKGSSSSYLNCNDVTINGISTYSNATSSDVKYTVSGTTLT